MSQRDLIDNIPVPGVSPSVMAQDDIEKGRVAQPDPGNINRLELMNQEKSTPEAKFAMSMGKHAKKVSEGEKHVLSLQADIISVLSGQSNTRSGIKYRRD